MSHHKINYLINFLHSLPLCCAKFRAMSNFFFSTHVHFHFIFYLANDVSLRSLHVVCTRNAANSIETFKYTKNRER